MNRQIIILYNCYKRKVQVVVTGDYRVYGLVEDRGERFVKLSFFEGLACAGLIGGGRGFEVGCYGAVVSCGGIQIRWYFWE